MTNKCCQLGDFEIDNSVDIFYMSETWLYDDDPVIMSALTLESHIFHYVPHPNKKVVELVVSNKSLPSKKQHIERFKSFKCIEAQFWNERKKVILNVINRPPDGDFSLFLQESESLILQSEINEDVVIYLGDFNIWLDDIGN